MESFLFLDRSVDLKMGTLGGSFNGGFGGKQVLIDGMQGTWSHDDFAPGGKDIHVFVSGADQGFFADDFDVRGEDGEFLDESYSDSDLHRLQDDVNTVAQDRIEDVGEANLNLDVNGEESVFETNGEEGASWFQTAMDYTGLGTAKEGLDKAYSAGQSAYDKIPEGWGLPIIAVGAFVFWWSRGSSSTTNVSVQATPKIHVHVPKIWGTSEEQSVTDKVAVSKKKVETATEKQARLEQERLVEQAKKQALAEVSG